jgi:undecaprenyl phosphate-alpha-L-ara4N flippase subunit ArnE
MSTTTTANWLPIIAAVISAVGQIMLKYAMLRHGTISFSPSGLLQLLFQPTLLLALMLYAGALLMWLQVLSKVPLSTAYPMLAVTYAIVPIFSIVLFGEKILQTQWIGIFLILAGVTLIGQTK